MGFSGDLKIINKQHSSKYLSSFIRSDETRNLIRVKTQNKQADAAEVEQTSLNEVICKA